MTKPSDRAIVEPNDCGCHPETCACAGYRLQLGDETLMTGSKGACERVAKLIDAAAPEGAQPIGYARANELEYLRNSPGAFLRIYGRPNPNLREPVVVPVYTTPPQPQDAEDAARLDWLDSHAFTAYRNRDPESGDVPHTVLVNEDATEPRKGIVRPSIRECIDAARAAGGGGE